MKQGLQAAVNKQPALKIFFEGNRGQAKAPLVLDAVAVLLESLSKNLSLLSLPRIPSAIPRSRSSKSILCCCARTAGGSPRTGRRDSLPGARRPARAPSRRSRLFSLPRSAAVIGASASGANPGRIILKNLKQSEGVAYGKLWAVHPKEKAIDGVPCVPSVAALPEKVDLAVVSVPAPAAPEVVAALADGKAESIILIPGGFGEAGRGDLEAALRKALADAHARPDGGPVLVGGNCLGIVSKRQYNTFFLPQYKLPFHDAPGDSLVAVSQSGAYLVSLTSNLDGIVFPRASISYGNQMDLTAADFLTYFADDPTVRLLVFYVEGFAPGDGERFVAAARRVTAEGRHVVVFKAGQTAARRRGHAEPHGVPRRRLRGREGAPRGRGRPGRPDARHVRGLHEGPHDARRPAARRPPPRGALERGLRVLGRPRQALRPRARGVRRPRRSRG